MCLYCLYHFCLTNLYIDTRWSARQKIYSIQKIIKHKLLAASWDPWQSRNFPHHNPRPKAQTHRVLQYVGQGNAPQGCGLQIANGWCEPVARLDKVTDDSEELSCKSLSTHNGIIWNRMEFHIIPSHSSWTIWFNKRLDSHIASTLLAKAG